MGVYVAEQTVKLLSRRGKPLAGARVGVLGLTFKEDVPDVRNSRVPDIIKELQEYGVEVLVHDPMVDPVEADHEYGIRPVAWEMLRELDGLVLAVTHRLYREMDISALLRPLTGGSGVVMDVKAVLNPHLLPKAVSYWRL
jgi:UDP-N-acetyl-D-galactosamine dehydrogenase